MYFACVVGGYFFVRGEGRTEEGEARQARAKAASKLVSAGGGGGSSLVVSACGCGGGGHRQQEEGGDRKQQRPAAAALDTSSSSSSILSPDRVERFSAIASSYDDKIWMDELVMGLHLLRWWLVSNASGEVLEVAAGTGRNIWAYKWRDVHSLRARNRAKEAAAAVVADSSSSSSSEAASSSPPPSGVTGLTVTDCSEQMVRECEAAVEKSLLREQKARTTAVTCDAARMARFGDNRFDTVVDTFGLCSFDDPVKVLKECARVVKPGGEILLLEHGRSKTWDWITRLLDSNAEMHAKTWGCVWNRDLDEIIERSGLNVEYLTTWHFGTTYYVRLRKPGGGEVDA